MWLVRTPPSVSHKASVTFVPVRFSPVLASEYGHAPAGHNSSALMLAPATVFWLPM
jgi:hypothetical protein